MYLFFPSLSISCIFQLFFCLSQTLSHLFFYLFCLIVIFLTYPQLDMCIKDPRRFDCCVSAEPRLERSRLELTPTLGERVNVARAPNPFRMHRLHLSRLTSAPLSAIWVYYRYISPHIMMFSLALVLREQLQ